MSQSSHAVGDAAVVQEGPRQRSVFGVYDRTEGVRAARRARRAMKQMRRDPAGVKKTKKSGDQLPRPLFGEGGSTADAQAWGMKMLKLPGIPTTAHMMATALPFLAGPSLGSDGVLIGNDLNGGGAFAVDPWELYDRGVISGMSAMFFGQVGSGKSSLAKSWAIRLVMAGRKLSVASDIKGEWTELVLSLGGQVIRIGPGIDAKINPLDAGHRPSLDQEGQPLTDQRWAQMVRNRRLTLLLRLVRMLRGGQSLSDGHPSALFRALDASVADAGAEDRQPIIPDVVHHLGVIYESSSNPLRSQAANEMMQVLERLTEGDMAGIFDGESTVSYDPYAPAVSLDTSAIGQSDPLLVQIVNACSSTWTESMVTVADAGQRVVVNEEGWTSMSSETEVESKVRFWKLARAYGIFNILILHKLTDLDSAGDSGSKHAKMARGLLAESDIKVIYRQDNSALQVTHEELGLSDRELGMLKHLDQGVGMWRVGPSMTFEVYNTLTEAERPLLNTDTRMETTEAMQMQQLEQSVDSSDENPDAAVGESVGDAFDDLVGELSGTGSAAAPMGQQQEGAA